MAYSAAQLQFREYDSSNVLILQHSAVFPVMPKTWTQLRVAYTSASNCAKLWPFVGSTGQSTSDLFYFDAMYIGVQPVNTTNLLTAAQYDLESGGTPWTANANGTFTLSTDQAHTGTHSLKLTPTSTSAASAFLGSGIASAVAASPSTAYEFDCWCWWNGFNYPAAKSFPPDFF